MGNFTATTTITTNNETLSASKEGTYNEVIKATQVVDDNTTFITLATGSKSKGNATLSDCKAMIIKNNGISGAELQISSYTITNGTPDVVSVISYENHLLGSGDYLFLPNWRKFKFSANASGGDAYEIDNGLDGGGAAVPHGDRYVAVNNAAGDDAQLLNGTELASGTTATSVTVDEGAYFVAGDLIRLENEICEVTKVTGNVLTIVRGTHGSTAATHADDVAIRYPFFNAYHNFTAATGGYDVVCTDTEGKFKCTNFFGYGRNTDGSNGKQSMGLVAGSISGKFYSAGYQSLGLKGITASTNTGLTASTAYAFDIQVDGGTNFDNLTFTTGSNVNWGGSQGVISKIQSALDTQYYTTASNLFEKKVTVEIVDGDVRFTSGTHLAASAIILTAEDGGDASFLGTGRVPAVAKLGDPVAAKLPQDTILDNKTGISEPNVSEMFYDDGHGNIKGKCSGTINYETGSLDLRDCPSEAQFVVSAYYGSGHSGGNKFSADDANSITEIAARSTSSKLNTTIEVIGLN